jgi:recombination protein RecT
MLDRSRSAIAAALPENGTTDRMIRLYRTAINKSPDLVKCAPRSVLASIIEAAQLGLEPNGVLGEGYLIPFWNNKTKQIECQFITGLPGLSGPGVSVGCYRLHRCRGGLREGHVPL